MKLDLDTLIEIEDALDAIGQKQSLDAFTACYDADCQQHAEEIYCYATTLIGSYGSRHKALAHIQRGIESYR